MHGPHEQPVAYVCMLTLCHAPRSYRHIQTHKFPFSVCMKLSTDSTVNLYVAMLDAQSKVMQDKEDLRGVEVRVER